MEAVEVAMYAWNKRYYHPVIFRWLLELA